MGDEVFERLTPTTDDTLWYYRAVTDALGRSGLESWLVDELVRVVRELEKTVGED